MKISWILLTMNRCRIAEECFIHNMSKCGRPPDEVVWVDNGSNDGAEQLARISADICVLNKKNLGTAHGFNTAFALATGDLIVCLGAYSKGPEGWLEKMLSVYEDSKADGVCLFHHPLSIDHDPQRLRGDKGMEIFSGLRCHQTIFIETCLFPKSVLERFGYFDEKLDPYWPCDVEYAYRCDAHGFRAIAIGDMFVEHCGRGSDIEPRMPNPDGSGLMPYYEWKKAVQWNPKVHARIAENGANGWPRLGFNQKPMI